jgi:hypothetical protein
MKTNVQLSKTMELFVTYTYTNILNLIFHISLNANLPMRPYGIEMSLFPNLRNIERILIINNECIYNELLRIY